LPPLRGLGEISYGLYRWHWPVCVLLSPSATGLDGWSWTAVVVAVSIAPAVVSKYLVEDPIRFRATWAKGRRSGLVFSAAMVGLGLLWLGLPTPAPVTVDISGL
jgi:peptidoglycan/LPS O-acetylase OafA/YrhL